MIFGDINFSEDDSVVLNLVKNYFIEAKDSIENTTTFDQMNYRIFILCAYVGLTIASESQVDLYEIADKDKDVKSIKFTVPRIILMQNMYQMKDLLICADYSLHRFIISEASLQRIWNMESYSENSELTTYISQKVVLGAKYLVNLISVNNTNVSHVANNIMKMIEQYKRNIDEEIVALEIEAEMLSHSE